jgi:glycosyltransferase involved in cell wall biosynthesis
MLGPGPVIGHVGALDDRHKGQAILLDAFTRLAADYPGARLVLVGEGKDREALRRQANGDSRIHFAGYQSDVGSWIAAMDIFAFPSREEGLGSSVLDAMAHGVPVVVAPVGGLPELAGRNERGLVMDRLDAASLESAIRALLSDAALRMRLVKAAREFALRHNVDEMTGEYVKIYHAILDRQARRLGWIDI